MIRNPSFEVAEESAPAGTPKSWEISTVATAEELADFAGDSGALPSAYEMFEHGWGEQDPQRLHDDLVGIEVELGLTDAMDSWAPNQAVIAMPGTEAATFYSFTLGSEDFERWGKHDIRLDKIEVVTGVFDGNPIESFTFDLIVTRLSATIASFSQAGGRLDGDTYETFSTWAPQPVRVTEDLKWLERTSTGGFNGEVGDSVYVISSGAVPSPLTDGQRYYVHSVSSSKVRLTSVLGGDPIDFANVGTGEHILMHAGDRCWNALIA